VRQEDSAATALQREALPPLKVCAGYIHKAFRTFPVAIKDVPLGLSGAAKQEIHCCDMVRALNLEPPAILPFHNFSEDAGAAIHIMYDAPSMTLQQSLVQRAMAFEEWVRPCSISTACAG
jgi:hypothetical protein